MIIDILGLSRFHLFGLVWYGLSQLDYNQITLNKSKFNSFIGCYI